MVRLARSRERKFATTREGDLTGAAVSSIGLAANEVSTLDTVDKLAGPPHRNAQCLGQVANAQPAVVRAGKEEQRFEERQRQVMFGTQSGIYPLPERNLQPDQVAQPLDAIRAIWGIRGHPIHHLSPRAGRYKANAW